MELANLAVFASGSGTNFQALIDKIHKQGIAKITTLISDNPGAYALQRAADAGIDACFIDYRKLGPQEFFQVASKILKKADTNYIALCGFLKIVPKSLVDEYPNRILNIHPSLIPSFCGDGAYGIAVHEAAINYGVKVSGATVHLVDYGVDTGPIVIQRPVVVENDDTPQSLQAKVLEIEHVVLPEAVELLVSGKILLEGKRAKILAK
ncbi:MAG: phosphoribosylglycinamide formyltransferase [Eubacteriaceae bacterium]|nr:phosphoribosylglycinamide formyltransferase [Eubacteriaceae bacterium]